MSLGHHNISKKASHDLTLLQLPTIVKISLTTSTSEPGHGDKCKTTTAVYQSMKLQTKCQ